MKNNYLDNIEKNVLIEEKCHRGFNGKIFTIKC